VRYY